MVLIALALLCVATVPLTGGSLARLAEVRPRGLWVPLLALAVQVVITVVAPTGSMALHRGLHIATYALIGVFLWANRRLAGMRLLALGVACNAAAIVANLGVMPASPAAERLARLTLRAGFDNSAPVAHAHLAWLGDIIPWPGPLPNVLSVGDLLIFAGMLGLLHRSCRSRNGRAAGETVGPADGEPSAGPRAFDGPSPPGRSQWPWPAPMQTTISQRRRSATNARSRSASRRSCSSSTGSAGR
ncbi:MAG TPA: DUF5317 domain-containing protein [Solirubrobacteraceae bacterium]|nr:DUF5317 domain-containing protein [Solirubrobacteraceae bacterium]